MLAFVDGITAAAIGAITGSVIVIARRSIVEANNRDAIITIVLLWRFKKLQEPVVVAAAALLGSRSTRHACPIGSVAN